MSRARPTEMVTARIPVETMDEIRAEAKRCNEPVSRVVLRRLQNYEGWSERDGAWDRFVVRASGLVR